MLSAGSSPLRRHCTGPGGGERSLQAGTRGPQVSLLCAPVILPGQSMLMHISMFAHTIFTQYTPKKIGPWKNVKESVLISIHQNVFSR